MDLFDLFFFHSSPAAWQSTGWAQVRVHAMWALSVIIPWLSRGIRSIPDIGALGAACHGGHAAFDLCLPLLIMAVVNPLPATVLDVGPGRVIYRNI